MMLTAEGRTELGLMVELSRGKLQSLAAERGRISEQIHATSVRLQVLEELLRGEPAEPGGGTECS